MPRRRPAALLAVTMLAIAALAGCGDAADEPPDPRLANPLLRPARLLEAAPDTFEARLSTTEGDVLVRVYRDWAPLGADRFYSLVRAGWYDGVRIHRVVEGFVAEWGIHDDPYVNAIWRQARIDDDPVRASNTRGRVTFSKSGRDSRTTQVFINLDDNASLDDDGFAPFGEVVEGMDVVDGFHADYGDGPPRGEGVYQAMAIARGAAYFDESFPELDRIERAEIVAAASGG